MPSPSDKDLPQPRSNWSRASAIEAFGVRYVQRRGWRDPVIESLGAHPGAEEVLDGCRSFASQGAAIQRAQADAREEAVRELERCDAFLKARSVRLRLALARTWRIARRGQVGILATATILEQRRREQNSILRNGVSVPVRRLPDPIRLPALLPLGRLVHVVDTRSFPRAALLIVSRPILAHAFVDAPSHREFDQLVRYRVRDLDSLSYDHAAIGADRLAGAPAGVEVFLEADEAERFVAGYASDVMGRLGKREATPPPVERIVEDEPIPSPPTRHASVEPESRPADAGTAAPSDPVAAEPRPEPDRAEPQAAAAAPLAPAAPADPSPPLPDPVAEASVPVPAPGTVAAEPVAQPTASNGEAEAWAPPPRVAEPIRTDVGAVRADDRPERDDPVAPVDPVTAVEPGMGASPRIEASDIRPARRRRGLLSRLFGRRAEEPVEEAPSYPEELTRPDPFPFDEPLPEAGPMEDHLPVGMIIDEMEAAVIELAASAATRSRPPAPEVAPPPPEPDPRHPETASFLARGGLVILTSVPPGAPSTAQDLVAALLPGSALEDRESDPAAETRGEGDPAPSEPEGLAA